MTKWYDEEGAGTSVVTASRIRLHRNIAGFPFPEKMADGDLKKLNAELADTAVGITGRFDLPADRFELGDLSGRARQALQERHLISSSLIEYTKPASMVLTKDESIALLFGGDDHLRLQVSVSGKNLEGAWARAGRTDDWFNERYPFAFDDKYGYLTAWPTHVGTGMRAYLILHLPILGSTRRFSSTVSEVGHFGIAVRNAFGPEEENYGDVYVIYNQQTLGQSEEEYIALVNKVGTELAVQEERLREAELGKRRSQWEDAVWRAYGTLRYARSLPLKESLELISRVRLGECLGLLKPEKTISLLPLMQGCLPATLCTVNHREAGEEELARLRAAYLRAAFPDMMGE